MPSRFWYLLARKLADEATLDEIRELERALLDNADNASMVEIYTDFFKKEPKQEISSPELEDAWRYQLDKMQDNPQTFGQKQNESGEVPVVKQRNHQHRFILLAAASVLMAAIGLMWVFLHNSQAMEFVAASKTKEIRSASDVETKTTLPDGSQIWLNKGSSVQYDAEFGKSNRNITLFGEAFFDVVHKAELPMVVHAGPVEIRVKGTAFNVKAYADDDKVEASLIRGSIELLDNRDKGKRLLMKPNEKVVVRSYESPDIKASGAAKHILHEAFFIDTLRIEERSGLIPEISWIQGKLVFNNEDFSELAGKLERWYKIKVIIEDKNLAAERFTGAFESETLHEALAALQFTYGFAYSIEGDKVIIKKK